MIPKFVKDFYWNLPILSEEKKSSIYYALRDKVYSTQSGYNFTNINQKEVLEEYRNQILSIPTDKDQKFFKSITENSFKRKECDSKLIAYYLPQMHPTPENDNWWGKGVTEWNNVGRAVPQYLGHYQPRQPGELGYYDLRIKDVIKRQVELAKMYGLFGFAWYFYSFGEKALLRKPLDMYINDSEIKFPFCLCWANESWTRSFFGSSKQVIMEQEKKAESYKMFIHDAAKYLKDERYITVNGKKVLIVYRPLDIPDKKEVTDYWREYCKKEKIGELYIIGNYFMSREPEDYKGFGLDALGEFQIGSLIKDCKIINEKKVFLADEFSGNVYDYKDLVLNKIYKKNFGINKMYNAVFPMWDNTPRRNNKDNTIFDGANPSLFKMWLLDVIKNNMKRSDLDDNLIFINSWNEWGEGSYIEPDKRYGYAYLQAIKEALEESK